MQERARLPSPRRVSEVRAPGGRGREQGGQEGAAGGARQGPRTLRGRKLPRGVGGRRRPAYRRAKALSARCARAPRSSLRATMPSYTVTVATGSQWFAGTDDYIYLSLVGSAGCSEKHLLDKPFYNDFERGAVRTPGPDGLGWPGQGADVGAAGTQVRGRGALRGHLTGQAL